MGKDLQTVALNKISVDTGFRVVLDTSNLDRLAHLRLAGVELDPVKVIKLKDGSYRLVSGNHRRQVALNLGDKEILAEILDSKMTEAEIIALGIKENAGANGKAPLPPTEADLRMILKDLLYRLNIPPAEAIKMLPYPAPYLKTLLNTVQATELKIKKACAMEYMSEHNVGPETAAKKFGLDPEQFKGTLDRKRRNINFDCKNPAKNDNAKIGARMRGLRTSLNHILKTAIIEMNEGKRSPKAVTSVLNHAETLLSDALNEVNNYRARVAAQTN